MFNVIAPSNTLFTKCALKVITTETLHIQPNDTICFPYDYYGKNIKFVRNSFRFCKNYKEIICKDIELCEWHVEWFSGFYWDWSSLLILLVITECIRQHANMKKAQTDKEGVAPVDAWCISCALDLQLVCQTVPLSRLLRFSRATCC